MTRSDPSSPESDATRESTSTQGRNLKRRPWWHWVLYGVLGVYFLGVMASFPSFRQRYARDQGTVSGFFLGDAVPWLQAMSWPYFAFASPSAPAWTAEELKSIEHFQRSAELLDEAMKIEESGLTVEKVEAIVSLNRLALDEALQCDVEALKKVHHDLPIQFEEKYISYLQILNVAPSGELNEIDKRTARGLISAYTAWVRSTASEWQLPGYEKK